MSITDDISKAIAQMESGGNPNALSYRNNNPGNLRSWGSNPIVNGYAKFPTMETGWAALRRQVDLNIGRGLSLQEFFAGQRDAAGNVIPGGYYGYSPSGDGSNDPNRYAQFVATQTGLPLNTPLNALTGASPPNPKKPPQSGKTGKA